MMTPYCPPQWTADIDNSGRLDKRTDVREKTLPVQHVICTERERLIDVFCTKIRTHPQRSDVMARPPPGGCHSGPDVILPQM